MFQIKADQRDMVSKTMHDPGLERKRQHWAVEIGMWSVDWTALLYRC